VEYQLLNVLVFTLFGIVFVVSVVAIIGRLLRPKVTTPAEPAKEETYECGEPAVGSSWVRFDIRFYTVALIFLIFDVEVAFLYPWALVFRALREAKLGLFVFADVFLFLLILGVGFIYCWRKGDLDWVKTTGLRAFPAHRVPSRAPPNTPPNTPMGAGKEALDEKAGKRGAEKVGVAQPALRA
jgi:NADH-quinone oxidoreductase subunit A